LPIADCRLSVVGLFMVLTELEGFF